MSWPLLDSMKQKITKCMSLKTFIFVFHFYGILLNIYKMDCWGGWEDIFKHSALCHHHDCCQLQNSFALSFPENPRIPFQTIFSSCLLHCWECQPCEIPLPASMFCFVCKFPSLLPSFLTSLPAPNRDASWSFALKYLQLKPCSKETHGQNLNCYT